MENLGGCMTWRMIQVMNNTGTRYRAWAAPHQCASHAACNRKPQQSRGWLESRRKRPQPLRDKARDASNHIPQLLPRRTTLGGAAAGGKKAAG